MGEKMPAKKGTGLLMVWCDVPEDREDEFNRWYNEEHIAEILTVPGVLDAARYEAVKGGPKHLACYELESPSAVLGDGFTKRTKSKWSETMGPTLIGQNFFNPLYQMIFPDSVSGEMENSGMAPALQIGRMNIPVERTEEWNQWYNSTFVPNFETVPGCIRGRRFKTVRGEDPLYSVVYEFENENVSQTPEWEAQLDADPKNADMRALISHGSGSPSIFRKTFEL
tara:strand:- start:1913 stop:2587 length:675 start_codon:yes stop_codon:yes gene_type:complete